MSEKKGGAVFMVEKKTYGESFPERNSSKRAGKKSVTFRKNGETDKGLLNTLKKGKGTK